MAYTTFVRGGTHANLVQQRWAKWGKLAMKWADKNSWFTKLSGESEDSIIVRRNDLKKEAGDRLTINLVAPLVSDGVVDDEPLDGTEEAMSIYDYTVDLHEYAHCTGINGKLTQKRTDIPLLNVAKNQLGLWWGQKKDTLICKALSGLASADATIAVNAPSTARKWYGGETAAGAVSANMTTDALIADETNYLMGPGVVSVIKRMARTANGKTYPKIRPIMMKGKEYYVMLISQYQDKAMRANTNWRNDFLNAAVRGESNPIFSGADYVIDGVLIHVYDKIEERLGAGGATVGTEAFESGDGCTNTVHVARALFLGAQAGVELYTDEVEMTPDTSKYGRKPGVGLSSMAGIGKCEFNGYDFGVITVDTAYTPDA
jgi:N4-gp56 family major capsid protein